MLDSTTFPITEIVPARGAWADIVKDKSPRERLVMLRDFLRTGAPNELWNYGSIDVDPECGTSGCALGWYRYMVGDERANASDFVDFSMPLLSDLFEIFFKKDQHGKFDKSVTPTDVADAIDRYLEAGQ